MTFKHDRVGWTIGAGAEVPLWYRWSAKIEYLYVDLGKVNDTFVSPLDVAQLPSTTFAATTSFSIHDNIVRGGLNYHFD
jgi:outer membrane immunogenic protein